jgi:hypothetical protein
VNEAKPPRRRPSVKDLSWADGERLSTEQQQLHADIDRINRWATDHSETFAGVWLDNDAFLAGTGPVRIGIGIAGCHPSEVAPELEALVNDRTRLILVPKRHPEAALRAAQERVVGQWMRGGGNSHQVTGCGVDIHENALQVMLREPDEALEHRIRSDVADLPVTVVYGYTSYC